MQEMEKMIWEWKEQSYEVDCSPLFTYLQNECDDDEDEETPMELGKWKTNDPVQATIFSRMYVQHVSDDDDKEVAHVWELRYDVKKTLHALKTIARL